MSLTVAAGDKVVGEPSAAYEADAATLLSAGALSTAVILTVVVCVGESLTGEVYPGFDPVPTAEGFMRYINARIKNCNRDVLAIQIAAGPKWEIPTPKLR